MIDENERGQSYERDDSFNVIGLAIFVYTLTLKRGKGIKVLSPAFEFELNLPFIRHLLESQSSTLNQMGREWLYESVRKVRATNPLGFSKHLVRFFDDLDHACKRTPAALFSMMGEASQMERCDNYEALQKLDLCAIYNYLHLYGLKG